MSIPRVLIAEPIYHALPPLVYGNRIQFWKEVWWQEFLGKITAEKWTPAFSPNSLIMGPRRNIRSARAVAIEMARNKKASHIFFVDDDVLTPPDILLRLLAVDQDIVGGLMHKDDGKPIVFRKELVDDMEDYWTDYPTPFPFECGGIGAGCMLIKTSVFDLLDAAITGRHWYFNYDEGGRSMDLRFCRNAMYAGAQVWCVPDPPCTQISHY